MGLSYPVLTVGEVSRFLNDNKNTIFDGEESVDLNRVRWKLDIYEDQFEERRVARDSAITSIHDRPRAAEMRGYIEEMDALEQLLDELTLYGSDVSTCSFFIVSCAIFFCIAKMLH